VEQAVPFLLRVPLSGFLNPSAVSWQTRVPRPYFVPQPFLGFPLRSVPLRRVARPSRGRWLPCSCPPKCKSAPLAALSPSGFPDAPAPKDVVAWFPQGAMAFLLATRVASRSAWTASGRTAPYLQLRPLRSVVPLAESVRFSSSKPALKAVTSLGFCPSKDSISNLGSSTRPGPEGPGTHPSRRTRAATPKGSHPSASGEAFPEKNVLWISFVGGSQSPSGPGRTASRRRLLLSWPWNPRSPVDPGLQSLVAFETWQCSEENCRLSWGFCLLTDLAAMEPRRSWLIVSPQG
jgi:hypothetical protein